MILALATAPQLRRSQSASQPQKIGALAEISDQSEFNKLLNHNH